METAEFSVDPEPIPTGLQTNQILTQSATHKFPDESNANPGNSNAMPRPEPVAVAFVFDMCVVKLGCPNTRVASSPFVNPVPLGCIIVGKIRIPKTTATIDIAIIK